EQPERAHFRLLDQRPHGSGRRPPLALGIGAMLVQELNAVRFEPSQTTLNGSLDMVRLAVDPVMTHAGIGINVPTELGGDQNLVLQRLERFAYHDLVGKRAVGLGRVKEVNTALDHLADESDHLEPVLELAGFAIAHATSREG